MDRRATEIFEEYTSSLVDLNVNSKPLINMLTELAEENIEHGQVIVDAIEQHISKAVPDAKLPVLYLIDSIVKNIKKKDHMDNLVYVTLFSPSIVNIFCGVFEQVDEKIRQKMFPLRKTWDGIFPTPKLYTLDVKVNCMDSGWPITAKAPSIHVNPNFFNRKPENDMQNQLRDKQRELLELQKRKLELELAATKKHIEEQELQLLMKTATVKRPVEPQLNTGNINVSSAAIDSDVQKKNQILNPQRPTVSSTIVATSQQQPLLPQHHNMPQRVRIASVNPALVSVVRSRDPRLAARQQLQQMNMENQQQVSQDGGFQNQRSRLLNNGNQQQQQSFQSTKSSYTQNNNNSQPQTSHIIKTNEINYTNIGSGFVPISELSRIPKLSNSSNSNNISSTKGRSGPKLQVPKSSSNEKSPSKHSSSTKSSPTTLLRTKKSSKSPSSKVMSSSTSSSRDRSKESSSRQRSSYGSDLLKKSRNTTSPTSTITSTDSALKHGSVSPTPIISSNEKSPSESFANKPQSTLVKFKDIKNSSTKVRNYMRRNRHDSKSPVDLKNENTTEPTLNPPSPPPISGITQTEEVTAELTPVPPIGGLLEQETVIPVNEKTKIDIVKNVPLEEVTEKKSDENPIECRTDRDENDDISVANIEENPTESNSSNAAPNESITSSVVVTVATTTSTNFLDNMKRASEERTLDDQPSSKKSKSEKIDILFGKEDVDYRKQIVPIIAPIPPPPPMISAVATTTPNKEDTEGWAKIKSVTPKSSINTSLEAVRAKLAEATRVKDSGKVKDVDLRQQENSQDGNNAQFKMILMQAKEQLANESINLEEYNNLMTQVMNIKEIKKRESLKRKNHETSMLHQQQKIKMYQHGSDEDFSSSGGESSNPIHQSQYRRDMRKTKRERTSDGERNSGGSGMENRGSKERRVRKSKWSATAVWEDHQQHQQQQQQFGTYPMIMNAQQPSTILQAPFVTSTTSMPNLMWQQDQLAAQFQHQHLLGNPSLNMGTFPPQQQFVMAPQHNNLMESNKTAKSTIVIDGIPRDIRFYDEITIAFMSENGGEPKEIGFQAGERKITVDNKDSIILSFNDTFVPFSIDNQIYQIRFGTPLREIYINNQWYECLFGDPPVGITLDGKVRLFKIEGPSPNLRIGSLRTDLVAGRIDLYIGVTIKIPVYLDAQVQIFQLDNQSHTLQFADYLKTVLIDNEPFLVEYGGMPKRFRIGGRDHFIRFSVLPDHLMAGNVYIKNMIRTDRHRDLISPKPIIIPTITAPILDNALSSQQLSHTPAISETGVVNSTVLPTGLPSINIDDLFQKLLASGILNTNKTTTEVEKPKEKEKPKPISFAQPETLKVRQAPLIHVLFSGMQCSSCGVRFPPEQSMKYSQHLDWHFRQNRRDRDSARRAHSRRWYYDVSDWIQYEEIEDLDDREKNWFETQQTEMDLGQEDSAQRVESPLPSCVAGPEDIDKTCDMCHDQFETFYNEENEEWHLRNAIRMDEKTYHPICYEDYKLSFTLDESAMNSALLSADDNAVDNSINNECDTGEQIILDDDDDDVVVVPQEEPIITEIPDDEEDETKTDATTDDTNNVLTLEDTILNETDLADVSSCSVSTTAKITSIIDEPEATYEPIGNESDIQILVPQISIVDIDAIEELPEEERKLQDEVAKQAALGLLKIKKEPKYEGYEEEDDDGFEEVGTFEETSVIDDDSVDIFSSQPVHVVAVAAATAAVAAPIVHQTQASLITSLDGNVQLQDAPTTIGTNKIKINITKNVSNKTQINANNEKDPNTNVESDNIIKNTTADALAAQQQQIDDIQFELKDSMKNVSFKKLTTVSLGRETSGLCSIM